jgi:hypothetical protein
VKGRTAAKATGRLLLYIKGGELQARPGQIIRWRSSLRQPSRFGNPGEFNYPLYLAARGIYVTSFLNRAEDLTVLVNHPAAENAYLENLRHSLATHIKEVVPNDAAGFLQSLLLGWRGGISLSSVSSSPIAVSHTCSQSPGSTSVFWPCSYTNLANGFTHAVNVWCSGAHPSGLFRFC